MSEKKLKCLTHDFDIKFVDKNTSFRVEKSFRWHDVKPIKIFCKYQVALKYEKSFIF